MFLSNRKLRYIIITLLLLIFCFFLGMFKPKALTYNVETQMKSQILIGSNYYGTYTWDNTTNAPEIVLDINKTISCDTSVCIASIPLTISYNHYVNTASSDTINFVWDYLGMYGQLWGSSPNYTCSYSGGSLDCPITNGQELKKIEIFVSKVNDSSPHRIQYTRGAFVNVFNVVNVGNTITNIQNNTNNINNSINDSSIDSNGASSSASSWNSKNATTPGTITDILTLPITLLSSIVNNINNSCSSFSLGSLFGTNITLPCIDISALIGSGLWTTIDILFSGFMILNIGKKFVKIFNDFTNLKSNQMDELYGGGSK